jgi:hypothetical protein
MENKDLELTGLKTSLVAALALLSQSLYFMNQVPNNKYYVSGGSKNHYELCSKISKFLNFKQNELSTM